MTIQEMVQRLKENSEVLGIIRYGSRRITDQHARGDLDLMVVLEHRPAGVESIHLFVEGIPVDLNLRSWADLEGEGLTPFEADFLNGEIVFDRTGKLGQELPQMVRRMQKTEPLSEALKNMIRFGQKHSLQKTKERLESDPLLSAVLLHSSVYWLIQNYFPIRHRNFPGEKKALAHIAKEDPPIYELLIRFYQSGDLKEQQQLVEKLLELVLQPIGGLWREDEILVFTLDFEQAAGLSGETIWQWLTQEQDQN